MGKEREKRRWELYEVDSKLLALRFYKSEMIIITSDTGRKGAGKAGNDTVRKSFSEKKKKKH